MTKLDKKENNECNNIDDITHFNKNITSIGNNSFENKKNSSRNGIVLGFKNSVIKLTREKMEVIKGLFPKEREKRSFSPCLNLKEINNYDKEYIRYLENNIELCKTPFKLRNFNMRRANCMTGKKYTSLETSKIINKLNNNNSTTIESKRNSELFLPYINKSINSSINNDGSTVKKINYMNHKVVELYI